MPSLRLNSTVRHVDHNSVEQPDGQGLQHLHWFVLSNVIFAWLSHLNAVIQRWRYSSPHPQLPCRCITFSGR